MNRTVKLQINNQHRRVMMKKLSCFQNIEEFHEQYFMHNSALKKMPLILAWAKVYLFELSTD